MLYYSLKKNSDLNALKIIQKCTKKTAKKALKKAFYHENVLKITNLFFLN
jgi:hypothetical protein